MIKRWYKIGVISMAIMYTVDTLRQAMENDAKCKKGIDALIKECDSDFEAKISVICCQLVAGLIYPFFAIFDASERLNRKIYSWL